MTSQHVPENYKPCVIMAEGPYAMVAGSGEFLENFSTISQNFLNCFLFPKTFSIISQ